MWYICTIEYYSTIRKNERLPFLYQHEWILKIPHKVKYVRQKKSRTTRFHSNVEYQTESNNNNNKKQEKQKLKHRQQYGGYQSEGGWELVKGKGTQIHSDKKFDFGWYIHNAIYR